METKWRSSLLLAEDKPVLLTKEPLSLGTAIQYVSRSDRGAIVTFSGTVREREGNRKIQSISYEAYEDMAVKRMKRIVGLAEKDWDVSVAIQHCLGLVPVQEASLVVACAGAHRQEAFEACQFVVDSIKREVPIWKVGFEWV